MEAKKRSSRVLPVLLLAAAVILIALSTVGTVRAALNEESEDYVGQVETKNIGVVLLENDVQVSGEEMDKDGALLGDATALGSDSQLRLGKTYAEELKAQNSGEIAEYIRVEVFKYWVDDSGNKDTSLDPSLIELELGSGWYYSDEESDGERVVLYSTEAVAAGATTSAFVESLTVSADLLKLDNADDYDGAKVGLKAEVKGVQTHNAAKAIKAAWGVDATWIG